MGKIRVLVCEFHQESNTFNPIVSPLEKFSAALGYEGQEIYRARLNTPTLIHGAVDVITAAGGEAIPTVFLTAGSGGRAADSVFELACERFRYYARQAGEFDAVYCDLHGATCTETIDDACGAFLKFVRELVGDKPIAASFDLHANITEQILQYADVICGYQTYPHADQYETGRRAATLLLKRLAGEVFYTATAAVPMLIPPSGYDTNSGPFRELIQLGHSMVKEGKLMDFTVFPVQPWLDIPEIASRVVTVASNPDTARLCCNTLAKALFALRQDAQPQLMSVDEVLDIAEKNTSGKPVILCESADSPNGGCVGDSPAVALGLQARNSKLRAALFVKDPEAVQQAFALGVGGTGTFSIGAKFTPGMPGPFVAEGTVCSLHDGYFRLEGPAKRGTLACIGKSAVVRFGTIDILLCHTGAASGDPQLFRHFGIEPTLYDLVVVKANTSFRLPYSKISDLIYCADTPGAGASNLQILPFRHLPKGLFPFAQAIDFTPAAKIAQE